MKKRTITIVVDQDGQTTIEAHGYRGYACRKATEDLEVALGGVLKRQHKSDSYPSRRTTKNNQNLNSETP